MKMNKLKWAAAACAMALVAACGEGEAPVSAEERASLVARAQTMMPADTALAEIYEYSCFSCHANPQTGAPLTGDVAAWAPRLEKGIEGLLGSTINGFEGMPPLGMCMDCSADQFVALIRFMSQTD